MNRCESIKGFTLVEMMIVVAIIAILGAIAMPNYREYLMRARISDATSVLATKRVQMEQFFQDNRTYAGAPACNADAATSPNNFDFSCAVPAGAVTYEIQAVGKNTMAGFTFTIDQDNVRRTAAVASGWSLPATNCWVSGKSGTC